MAGLFLVRAVTAAAALGETPAGVLELGLGPGVARDVHRPAGQGLALRAPGELLESGHEGHGRGSTRRWAHHRASWRSITPKPSARRRPPGSSPLNVPKGCS